MNRGALMSAPTLSTNPKSIELHKADKGLIFWFDFTGGDPNITTGKKIRPACVIGRTNKNSNRVIISPISDIDNYLENGKLKYPYHVPLLKSDYQFMEKDSVILLDQVFTIPKSEIYEEWVIGQVVDMNDMDAGLLYNYDLFQSVIDGVIERVSVMLQDHKSKFSRQ